MAPVGGVLYGNPEAPVRRFLHRARQAPDVVHAESSASLIEIFKAFAEGADVHVEDLHIHVRMVFLQHQGALHGVHAADIRAIGVPFSCRSRANTLHETDRSGLPAVGGPDDLPFGWPSGVDETFEFQAGQDVFESGVAVFVEFRWIIGIKAGCHNDGADLFRDLFIGHVEVDAVFLAGFNALGAHRRVMPQAFIGIERIGGWDRLRKRRINGFPRGQSQVEPVRANHRADLGALAACRAFLFIHVTGFLEDFHCKIAHRAFDADDFTERESLIRGCRPTSVIFGPRIQMEQSMVGKVLSS